MANNVLINLIAKDKASKAIKDVSNSFEKSSRNISSALGGIVKTAGVVGVAISGIGVATFKLASDSAKNLDASRFFFKTFGDEASGSLDKLRKASKGTISDMDLMLSANKASLLGVTDSTETLAKIMEVARLRGKAMGLTATQAFNDIVIGIGRGSPLILDNLGIKIPDAFKEMTKEMSSAQKTQELVNLVLKDGANIAKELGGDVVTAGDTFAQMQTKMANLKQEIGERVLPVVINFTEKVLTPLIDKLLFIPDKITGVIDFFKGIGEAIGQNNEPLQTNVEYMTKIEEKAPLLENAYSNMTPYIKDNKEEQKGFNEKLKDFLEVYTPMLKDELDKLKIEWGKLMKAIKDTGIDFNTLKDDILTIIEVAFLFLIVVIKALAWFLGYLAGVVKDAKEGFDGLKKAGEALRDFWREKLLPTINKISEAIGKLFGRKYKFEMESPKFVIEQPQYTPSIPMSFPNEPVSSVVPLQGFANGGNVIGNKPILVGERGAEVFVPNTSGTIIPNEQIGGNITLNVNVGMYAGNETEKRRIAEKLYESLVELAQGQGKTVQQLMGA